MPVELVHLECHPLHRLEDRQDARFGGEERRILHHLDESVVGLAHQAEGMGIPEQGPVDLHVLGGEDAGILGEWSGDGVGEALLLPCLYGWLTTA